MRPQFSKRFRFPAAIAAGAIAMWLTGCLIGGKEDPHGSEVENEMSARIYLADGSPAAGATVRVYPVDHNPKDATPKASAAQGLVFSTKTDAKGRYSIDSLPRGEYNILSDKDGEVAYQDSVFIEGSNSKIASDTLDDPGSITGRVVLQPGHDTRSVTVELLGTNIFVNVDEAGRFMLSGLAGGTYRARATTTFAGYTPTFVPIKATSGRSDSLGAPIILTYTDIPLVESITAAYDTVTGRVSLDWKPVQYANLREYVIFAVNSGSILADQTLIGTSRLAHFEYNALPVVDFPDFARPQRLEFRVAVRNKSLNMGDTYASVEVDIAPPEMVRTDISWGARGLKDGMASIGDTILFLADFANPTRRNRELKWTLDGSGTPIRAMSMEGSRGSDALSLGFAKPGRHSLTLSVTDAAGTVWSEAFDFEVVLDQPVVFPNGVPELDGVVGDTVRIRMQSADWFGRIVKWEWEFEPGTGFVASSGPDTTVVLKQRGEYRVAIRVTDDDGVSAIDTLRYVVHARPAMVEIPAGSFVSANGDTVKVAGFLMSNTEVTFQQWKETVPDWEINPANRAPQHPALITMDLAIAYCNSLSRKDDLLEAYWFNGYQYRSATGSNGYRMPTEQEWEYAARGGMPNLDWEWSSPDSLEKYAWYSGNSMNQFHPCGLKAPNAFGLYDIAGNAGELIGPQWVDGNLQTMWRFGGTITDNAQPNSKGFPMQLGRGTQTFPNPVGFRVVRPK